MPGLRYHRPSSIAEACDLSRAFGANGVFLAGGTELLPDFRRERETAEELISLQDLRELRGITVDGDSLHIGSLTTVAEVARSTVVEQWAPALWEAARLLGSPQIRSRATVGGNFCRAVSCADLPPASLVADAVLRLTSGEGTRDVKACEFFVGARRTVLGPGDLLVSLVIPRQPEGSGMAFERFGLRRGISLAVASVAARVRMRGADIVHASAALGAVTPAPVLIQLESVLRGGPATPRMLQLAAEACADAARPISDVRGSAEFRREIVAVLARRALDRAIWRAQGGGLPA